MTVKAIGEHIYNREPSRAEDAAIRHVLNELLQEGKVRKTSVGPYAKSTLRYELVGKRLPWVRRIFRKAQ